MSITLIRTFRSKVGICAAQTLNDALDDRSPAAVLHGPMTDDELEQAARSVSAAARALLAGQ